MKKLKGYIPTMTMMAVLLLGTTFANASISKADNKTPDTCTETTRTRVNWGVIITGLTSGIEGFTGVIITGLTSGKTTVNCGVIITGKEGG